MHIVEKIDGDKIVLEVDGKTSKAYSKESFDFDVKVSDVVIYKDGKFTLDEANTIKRKQKLIALQKKLFDK